MTKIWYIASPITHQDPMTVQDRLESVVMLQAHLMKAGVVVYCPHAHWSHATKAVDMPESWDFWKKPSFAVLSMCDGLIVYRLPGWAASVGVQDEIAFAKEMRVPIVFCEAGLEVMMIENLVNGKVEYQE